MIKVISAIIFFIIWLAGGQHNDSCLAFSLFLLLSSHLDDIEHKIK